MGEKAFIQADVQQEMPVKASVLQLPAQVEPYRRGAANSIQAL